MRRKNLLEAFKRSDESPGGTPAPAGSSVAPKGPVPGLAALAASARPGRAPVLPLVLVGVVVAFALGYLVGRRAPSAEASEVAEPAEAAAAVGAPGAPGAPVAPPVNQPRAFQEPLPAAADAETPQRIEESALFDPRNLYTVAVASYGKNHPDLAWATYEHLKEAGLAVFPPIESGNMLAIFVGATPTLAELADTEAAIKKLTRDGKKAAYGDAYRARIDKLIPRKTGS
jgi:hypothetical protein